MTSDVTVGRTRVSIAALVAGLLASLAAVGFAMITSAGADLFRFCLGVATAFFIAGIASGGERAVARALIIVIAGCVPVVALAATGIAFASAPWLIAYIVTASVFASVGAASRALPIVVALVVSATAWVGLFDGGRVAIGWLVERSAFARIDEPVAPFVVTSLDGTQLRSADQRDKVVVVAAWASWCLPCRAEMPELDDVTAHYLGDLRVVVWRLDLDRDDHHAAEALGVTGLPAIVIVGRDGHVRVRHTGYDESEQLAAGLEREIDGLLR